MTGDWGKPVHFTNGERRLIAAACEESILAWQRLEALAKVDNDKDAGRVCRMRQRQYQRIILECKAADPEPKPQ